MSQWGAQKHWTPARVIQAIRDFYRETGWYPDTRDFATATPRLPSRTTVFRLFGSLAEARRQAGMAGGGCAGHGGRGRGGGWEKGRKRPRGRPVQHQRKEGHAKTRHGNPS
jgi:hypothetical protein